MKESERERGKKTAGKEKEKKMDDLELELGRRAAAGAGAESSSCIRAAPKCPTKRAAKTQAAFVVLVGARTMDKPVEPAKTEGGKRAQIKRQRVDHSSSSALSSQIERDERHSGRSEPMRPKWQSTLSKAIV